MEEHSNRQRSPFLFTGKELDEEIGLYYFGARYYDPRTSVWQSPDAILGEYLPSAGLPLNRLNQLPGEGGVFTPVNLNLFAYSHQRPISMLDPDGRAGMSSAALNGTTCDGCMVKTGSFALDFVPIIGDIKGFAEAETGWDYAMATVGLVPLVGDAVGKAGKFAGRLLRKTCSFHGDTLVQTDDGLIAISDIVVGDKVLSRDAKTGEIAWRKVSDVYSNLYDETITLTIRDVETGAIQTIVSNRIHPFFVQLPGDTNQVALRALALSSEGHVYTGPIPNGAWIDAADLQPGFRLLNGDQSWAEVVTVEVAAQELRAFNLTVDGFHTYFVAGTAGADAVWVHNNCIPNVSRVVNSNMAHAANDRFARAGFGSPQEAREALQSLGQNMRRDGLPADSVMHQFQDNRVFVPVGDGYALYSFNDKGRYTLQTLVTKDMPFQRVVE